MRIKRASVAVAITAIGGLLAAACGGSSSGGSTSSGDTYKLGVLIDQTGTQAALASGTKGVDAYIKYVNDNPSKFNNVKLSSVVVDDGSTAQGALTGAQKLVEQDHVFAIISVSSFLFAAQPYLLKAGVPVFGSGFDGPEWNDPTNTNMFTTAPADYTKIYATNGTFMKSQGVTKCAAVGDSDSPSSSKSAHNINASCEHAGLPDPYTELIKFADTDYGPIALAIKKSGADGVSFQTAPQQGFGIAGTLQALGAKMKVILFADGYGGDLLASSAAVKAAQGYDFQTQVAPIELNTPATKLMASNLAAVGVNTDPTFGEQSAYTAVAAFAAGATKTGAGVSQSDFTKTMRAVTGFTSDGLFAAPIDFASYSPTTQCVYIVKLTGNKFVPLQQNAFCGGVVGTVS